jgi:hypothetical protein
MNEGHKKKTYKFFVDAKEFTTDEESVTGARIKEIAGVTATYQLYEEEPGDKPDKPIADSESVDLKGKEKQFYAVPPATFGSP